jgi:hypothetical protein
MFRLMFVAGVAYAAIKYGPDALPPSPLSVVAIVVLVGALAVMALATVFGEPRLGN